MLKKSAALVFLLTAAVLVCGQGWGIFQDSGGFNNRLSPLGINTQGISRPAIMALNRMNAAAFWTTSTGFGGGANATAEEQNVIIDQYQNPVTLAVGRDGTALTATHLNVFPNVDAAPNYPGGPNSYQLLWTGQGASWVFAQDITGNHATCGSNCLSLDVTPSVQMEVDLIGTGINSTVTFSGTTVSWTGSNFSNGTPVVCQAAGATLPTQITTNTVYYAVNASANSFGLATTIGGSAITFSGQSGTPKCYGDWARNIILVQTKYASLAQSGELWNPDYVAYIHKFRMLRAAQMMNVYQGQEYNSNENSVGAVTFSGTTVTWNGSYLGDGMTVKFWVNSPDTLPSPLVQNQVYYVVQAGKSQNTFKVAATQGGTPITFSGGSGTFYGLSVGVFTDSDRTIPGALFWNGTLSGSVNVNHSFGIPPIEAMIALANEANVDLYINIPHQSDTSWNTSAATIAHNKLNSNLKIYLEESNEIWSFAANVVTGWCRQVGNAGIFQFPLATQDGQCIEYYIYKAIADMATWTSVWGTDSNRIIRVLGIEPANTGYGQFIATLWAGNDGGSNPKTATITIGNPSISVSSLPSYAVAGSPVSFTTTGALPTGITATTYFSSGSGLPSGTETTYYISINGLTSNSFEIADTKAHALAGTNTITPTGSQSGTQTVQFLYWSDYANTHFDRIALSSYFPANLEPLPEAWSANADGGLANFYTEYSVGGLLPTANSASHTTGGTSLAFTVTSSQSFACPPPNGSIVKVKWNQANGSNATMDADGCTTHPAIQNQFGATAPANSFAANDTSYIMYTDTVCQTFSSSGCAVTKSVSPGWRFEFPGAPNGTGGYVQQTIDYLQTACTAFNTGLGMIVMNYESGQQLNDNGQGDTLQANMGALANRSTQMGRLYTQFYNQYPSMCIHESNHYADISGYGDAGFWGLTEFLGQSPVPPKYTSVINFVNSTPCWWAGCGN